MSGAEADKVPRHIAIVMDGNGRWAKARHRPRSFGHNAGRKAVREVVESCLREGVQALTLFAFSSENWKRPEDEVGALMGLFLRALDKEVDELHGYGVRLRFIGDLSAFDEPLRERMHAAMVRTAGNDKLHVNVAVNYGGRWDIVQASRQAADAVPMPLRDPLRRNEHYSVVVEPPEVRHVAVAPGKLRRRDQQQKESNRDYKPARHSIGISGPHR